MKKYVGHTIGLYSNLKNEEFYLASDVRKLEEENADYKKVQRLLRRTIVDLYYKVNPMTAEHMADKTIKEVRASETY